MQLRKWQAECVSTVLNTYKSGKRHFLCLATPGAGKTTMAAEVAFSLLESGKIDFVLCFSPSVIVAQGIRETLERRTGYRLDGSLAAKGNSYTYQSMRFLDANVWELIRSHNVLVIFDEIHHCSGSEIENANAWGEPIISKIQGQATYTLALTGTPWRSDKTPIVLGEYTDDDSNIVCDYVYGLGNAIEDKVCRTPQIVVIDNDDISLQHEDGSIESFDSFVQLLSETEYPYQQLVKQDTLIRNILMGANAQLAVIRNHNPNAAGLVIASSVDHASNVVNILRKELNQSAVIVTYKESEPSEVINEFRSGTTPWIVSVGMISEGTDIPRLQVCCHLSRIKTELHFRQGLGRILRTNEAENQDAFMYMPAEQTLVDYAMRLDEDIPSGHGVVSFRNLETKLSVSEAEIPGKNHDLPSLQFNSDGRTEELGLTTHSELEASEIEPSLLRQTYEANLDVFGKFHQEVINLSTSLRRL